MSNSTTYLYSHIGQIPQHVFDSIKSIYNVDPSSNIYVATDSVVDIPFATVYDINGIISAETKKAFESDYEYDHGNPLWKTAMLRVFILRDLAKKLNIAEYVHFDGDVILYEPFKNIVELFDGFDGLSITPCNSHEMVYGYSYIANIDKNDEICYILSKMIHTHNHLNEMQLLSLINKDNPHLIQPLPTLPTKEHCGYIFDPSSYGQYFGGTFQDKKCGWTGDHHWIGHDINTGVISPEMINNKPFVKHDNILIPIVNLHIHSKNTGDFI